jgi:hypothetical protein
MPKAFLSHSSKQKGYVDVVAAQLSKNNIGYDKFNFEVGGKTIDEIYRELESSDIFVIFLSNDALESKWVKDEIVKAEQLFKDGQIKKLLPIIIDNNIDYKDNRIQDWIKENYNLQYVSRPTKAVERIKQNFRLLSWELYPINKRLNQLFIGRNEHLKKFEERVFNFDLPIPISIFVSGLPAVGRRKFLTHSLKNANKIPDYYTPPIIVLNGRDSIENLIINIYDLGYSDNVDLKNLISKTIDAKIDICYELISDLEKSNNILYILDNYCIASQEGVIVQWFVDLTRKLEVKNRILICLASRTRIRPHTLFHKDFIFTIDLPELNKNERSALFLALLEIENIQLNREQVKIVTDIFQGFPEQIFYAITILKGNGIEYLLNNLNLLVEYNSSKVTQIIQSYEENDYARDLIRLLAEFPYISFGFLSEILGTEQNKYLSFITQFSNNAIIEYIGASKENIRLNDSIKDYVLRTGIPLNSVIKCNLKNHAEILLKEYITLDRDVSDFNYIMQYALEEGKDIPQEYLIPSHYLNTMKEIYDYKRNYYEVVVLADRVLENADFIDERIKREIRYWLCLSLARIRSDRFLKEVQRIDGPDKNFLLGFYYRLKGQNEKAIERLNDVIKQSPNFYRAKRELVQVFLNINDYESAITLAKENYENDRANPYYIQSYYRCLVKLRHDKDDIVEIEKVLTNLSRIKSDKAQEMYLTAKAQYEAFINNDKEEALGQIDSAIEKYPDNIHPKLLKIDICLRFKEINLLEKLVFELEGNHKQSDVYSSIILSGKIKLLVLKNKHKEANELIETRLRFQMPEYAIEKLRLEISKM